MNGDQCGSGNSGKELYRIPSKGKIAGVCAGLADYFGWETWLIRILVVSGVLFGMPFLIMIYIAGWFILDKKPNSKNQSDYGVNNPAYKKSQSRRSSSANEPIKVKSRVWQAGEPPKQAFHDIRRKFNHLENQLRAMESYVTSAEFTVSREINNL